MKFENDQYLSLAKSTATRYLKCGRFTHGFVTGKLRHDPVYKAILNLNILSGHGIALDLGCGRGILFALLTTLRNKNQSTKIDLKFQGIELRANDARIASEVLGAEANIINADVRTESIPACQVIFLLDVLLYMDHTAQEAILKRVAAALQPSGILVMREANAGAGWRFLTTWVGERFCALARGHWRQSYNYRPQQDWEKVLANLGFKFEAYPMSEGTPFANVLFVAKLYDQNRH